MLAAAADNGVAPAAAEASAKLLASLEVDELEARLYSLFYIRNQIVRLL